MEIEKQIREILKDDAELIKPVEKIELDESLLSLGIDSISIIKVILSIEEKFSFTFSDEDLTVDNFINIERIIGYVRDKIQ